MVIFSQKGKEGLVMMIPNSNVYNAAHAFSRHEPVETIENLLLNCMDIDEGDVEKILSISSKFVNSIDGGYSAFLHAVNLVLHTKAYCMEITDKKSIKNCY